MRLLVIHSAAAVLTSCTGTRPQPDARPNAPLAAPPVKAPSAAAPALPALLPRLTDAIGLSTPEGRARRQARKDMAATAPRIGKKAQGTIVTGNHNTVQQAQAAKGAGPATAADSGAVVTNTAIGKNKAPAATAPQAHAEQTVQKPGFWGAVLGLLRSCWWLVLLALAILFRKRLIPGFPF